MPLLPIILSLVIVGVVLYLVSLIPMDPAIQIIIRVLVLISVILWLLTSFVPGMRIR